MFLRWPLRTKVIWTARWAGESGRDTSEGLARGGGGRQGQRRADSFVRIVPQLSGLGASVAQAKELLRRLKRQQRVRVRMLADAEDAQRGLAAARILGLSHRRLSLGRSLSGGSKAAWNRSRK